MRVKVKLFRGNVCVCLSMILVSTLFLAMFIFNVYLMNIQNQLRTTKTADTTTSTSEQDALDVQYVIPNAVFYVWCGRSTLFQFRHFLSVKSVMKFVQPDKVVLFYEEKPSGSAYDTWLSELIDTYPMFSIEQLPANWCRNMTANIELKLFETGGIYIRWDVILTSFDHQYRCKLSSLTMSDSDGKPLVVIRRRHLSASDLIDYSNSSISILRGKIKLPLKLSTVERGSMHVMRQRGTPDFVAIDRNISCVSLLIVEGEIFPENIWKLDCEAGRLLRIVMYDTPHFVDAVQNYDQLAPNIAHIVWTNNDTMSFHFYLCVLSLVDVAQVEKLYIHGDSSPSGFYWNIIKDHPKIHLVYRTMLGLSHESAYGHNIQIMQHITDLWRSDILRKYGGLYVDTDVLFFRPLDRDIRSYDAVISKDVYPQPYFPDFYENAVMIGKPGARLWTLHIEAYRQYDPNDYLLSGCKVFYKIKERHPEVVHENPNLNVICYNYKCFPTWNRKFRHRTGNRGLKDGRSMRNWKTKSYAIHHTYPDLPEFSNHSHLLANNGTTLFGEVGLYILEQAGKIEYFVNLST